MYFYAFDGDNIGRKLEYLILTNDCAKVSQFSSRIQEALDIVVASLRHLDCNIVFCGGDSILASSEFCIPDNKLPYKQNEITFSVGIGITPTRALLALKLAKGRGKCCVVTFQRKEV